jgi:sterol desaturase/sphingolipid hydroxylase (fatty acid hydroxylase superfamily)
MRLSKTGYYADFAIYAAVITAATVITAWRGSAHEISVWLLATAAGVITWTLIEYVIHRFVFHQMPVFSPMHGAHHDAPLAFVGTPTWLSLGVIFGAVFLPAWALGSVNTASGLAVGVMAGFFWYGVVHHAIHHRKPRMIARRLIVASRRHSQHHYATQPGNFGVTTLFWDRVFGTVLTTSVERSARTNYQS